MADIFELFGKIEKNTVLPLTHIIAGLGNPGKEYDGTRHNAGFEALDMLSEKYGVTVNRLKFDALTAEAVISDKRVLLMKPQTFMNKSGESIAQAVNFYKIPVENVTVICDDISFEPGIMRIRRSGSAGGHNGLKNIILHLGSDGFPRVKLGVGKLPEGGNMINWVLGKIPADSLEAFKTAACRSVSACELILQGNIEKAMCDFN